MKKTMLCLLALVVLVGCATTEPPFKAGDEIMPRTGEPFTEGVRKIKLQNTPDGDVVMIYGKSWNVADLQLVPATPAVGPLEIAKPAAPAAAPAVAPAAAPAVAPAPAAPPAAQPPPAKPAEKPAPPKETKIKHAAIGATVTASSTNKKYPEELPPSALVDGDLTTRWASEYTEPQTVEVKLEKPIKIKKVRVYWETAVAAKYALSVSSDGKTWDGMFAYLKPDAKPEPRVDEINLNNVTASFIKLDLTGRVNPEWGFSIYEIEVVPAD